MKEEIVISTFYKFFDNPNFEEIRLPLKEYAQSIDIKGIIIMAKEGLNATISGTKENTDLFFAHMKKRYGFSFNNIKTSFLDYYPFLKMKVKAKKEIVTLKMPEISGKDAGHYVKAQDWDSFIAQDDVVLIDTRNAYEIAIGTFQNSINPHTEEFCQFPLWFETHKENFKNKKIAMCCTGGVRCEKSTAYLKSLGLKEVYHLEGGILKYLEELGDKAKMWQGDCFVFDHRIAVNNDIKQVKTTSCLD